MHPAVEAQRSEMLAIRGFAGHWLLFKNPPDLPRLRAALSGAFTPRVTTQLRPRIEALVSTLLDAVADRGELDLVRHPAFPCRHW